MKRARRLAAAASVSLVVLGTAGTPRAQGLDAASAEALAETVRLLQNPALRNLAIARDPKAAAADREVRALSGPEDLTQELYALAADVFRDLARRTGGDVHKLSEALERGRHDPAGFAARLSPQTLERLRVLSTRLPARTR